MFYLANDVIKPWAVCLKGSPVEIISARDKSAIIIQCQGERLTVGRHDLTDVAPTTKQPESESKKPTPAIKQMEVKSIEPKSEIKKAPKKVIQPTIF